MISNRLAGHTLPSEGRIYHLGVQVWHGSARCSCGERSPELDTVNARRRWHQEHKAKIRETQEGDTDGQ